MEPESSLPYSQVPATCPYSESIRLGPRLTVWMFRNEIRFYGEEFLAPSLNPQLEDHPLSTARDFFLTHS
jgi:hypothetical protein